MPISQNKGLVTRGSIKIGLSDLQKQRTVAIKAAQEIGEGFKKSFNEADKSVNKLNKGLGTIPNSARAIRERFRELKTEGVQTNRVIRDTADAIAAVNRQLKNTPKNSIELGGLPQSAQNLRSRFSASRGLVGSTRGVATGLDETKSKLREVATAAQYAEQQIKKTFTATAPVVNNFNQQVQSTSGRLRQAFQSVALAVNRLLPSLQRLPPRLEIIRGRLNKIQGELTAITLAGAAFTTLGLRAADNLRNLQIRFREIAGDQERGLALMEEIGEAAANLNLPIRETQTAFAGLVPAIRDAGGEVEEYVNLVARLATINPREGVAGAVFAVREALASGGTDLVSLAERFNLPRRRLRELIEETGSFGNALDKILDEQGATNAALESFSGNLGTATTRLRDAATRGLERAFLPQLDTAVSLINSASEGIDAMPDGFVQFAGGAITATTAAAGFALGLAQILETYKRLQQAGVFAPGGLGGKIGAAAIVGGGLAAAPEIATRVVNTIGRVTGNEEQANQTTEQTNQLLQLTGGLIEATVKAGLTALRQAFIAAGVAILDSVRTLAKSLVLVAFPLLGLPADLETFKRQLNTVTAGIVLLFGNFALWFSRLFPDSDLNQAEIESVVAEGQQQIQNARLQTTELQDAAIAAIDETFDNLIVGFLNATGAISDGADDASQSVSRDMGRVVDVSDRVFANVSERIEEMAERLRERVQDIEQAIQFHTELNRLEREGTIDQVTARVDGLEDERAAIEALLPELQALARGNNEAAQSLKNYQQRLTEIDTQINQLAQITPAIARRALDELANQFADDIREIEQERSDALTNLATKVREDLAKLDKDLAAEFTKARKEEIEAVQDFQKDREKIEKEHAKRLLEIERKGRESIIDAASRLDAAGVAAAIAAQDEEEKKAQERFEEENERNEERLTELRENLSEERREILNNYNQRRQDILTQGNIERMALVQKYNAEISARTQAYQAEAQLLNQYLTQSLNQQKAAINAQLSAQKAGYDAMVKGANAFAQAMAGTASSLAGSISGKLTGGLGGFVKGSTSTSGKPSTTLSGSGITMGSYTPSAPTPVIKPLAGGGGALRFHDGGKAIVPGGGEALAYVKHKEGILNPTQTRILEQLATAMTASNGSASGLSLDKIDINLTGAESFEDMVHMTVMQTLVQVEKSRLGSRR